MITTKFYSTKTDSSLEMYVNTDNDICIDVQDAMENYYSSNFLIFGIEEAKIIEKVLHDLIKEAEE